MTALHVLGADHFWSYVPIYVVLGLFVFLGALALRTRLRRYVENNKPSTHSSPSGSDSPNDEETR